jgi:hypothetical protein
MLHREKMDDKDTPWDRVKASRSVQQERRTARMRGGRAQINSGRIWSSLRDAKLNSFIGLLLIDNKTTENQSYTITKRDFTDLKRDAQRTPPGCHPALQIDIQDLHLMCFELGLWDEIVKYVIALESQIEELERGGNGKQEG